MPPAVSTLAGRSPLGLRHAPLATTRKAKRFLVRSEGGFDQGTPKMTGSMAPERGPNGSANGNCINGTRRMSEHALGRAASQGVENAVVPCSQHDDEVNGHIQAPHRELS
jgi:hypothetical protein